MLGANHARGRRYHTTNHCNSKVAFRRSFARKAAAHLSYYETSHPRKQTAFAGAAVDIGDIFVSPVKETSEFVVPPSSVTDNMHILPAGMQISLVSRHPSNSLPFLLYFPDIDGAGVTSRRQWDSWSEAFEMHAVLLDPECLCSFNELATATERWLTTHLADVCPTRPVYLLGEGFGAVLALKVAWECRHIVNRLILVNPATSYADSQLSRLAPLLERLPPALLKPSPPPSVSPRPQLPLPLPSLSALTLPLALAPLLGTSPQTLLRQLSGSIAAQQPGEAVQALSRALQQVSQIASRLTPAAFLHRLRVLEEGISEVAPLLPRIPARTLIVAGAGDLVLGSEREAGRLEGRMPRAWKKVLPESGHALLHEPGGELLPLLAAEGFYITSRTFTSHVGTGRGGGAEEVNTFGGSGPVEVPNEQEIQRYAAAWTARIRELSSPVFVSTAPDGTRMFGLGGLPRRRSDERPAVEGAGGGGGADGGGGGGGIDLDAWAEELGAGPLLFVGNHQLYALDMSVMVEEVLRQRGILMRGLAHPGLFQQPAEETIPGGAAGRSRAPQQGSREGAGSSGNSTSGGGGDSGGGGGATNGGGGGGGGAEVLPPAFMGNMFQTFGAVKVTPTAMYRLLAAGEAVLLYPGGVREGFKRRNEKYELFWPQRSEFVRMCARFGATIIPVSAVGLEDSLNIVMDSDDIMRSNMWGARARDQAASAPRARVGVSADPGLDESFVPPLVAPSLPARLYFHFGRPIRTTPEMYKDRAACDQVYQTVRSEVEGGISYLLRKREQDPHKEFLPRLVYERNPPFGPRRTAPTFKL